MRFPVVSVTASKPQITNACTEVAVGAFSKWKHYWPQLGDASRYVGIMMPPYFFAFLDELKKREHNVESWQFTSDETCPKLTLAARHPCVGPLVLYDEGNELTLEFGTKYHCHFHGSEAISREADKMIEASRLAANFVDRILHERIGVAVYFNDRGCTGA